MSHNPFKNEKYFYEIVEKIKIRLKFLSPPRKSCLLRDNVEKFCTAGQATDDNMVHAHCMLDNEAYKHRLRICNTYSLSQQ